MDNAIINIEHVTYTYPGEGRAALRDFSLRVFDSEFLLVTGVSGAGKSTMLRLFNGLVPHFYGGTLSGSVRVAGRDPVAEGPGDMSDVVGLVFQDPEAQFVAEIVEDEMAFAMENAGLPLQTMRKRVEEALNALGIEHLRGRRVSTLSGGERELVAIASVLTLHPRVLVLDEPTSQLDPQSAEEVLDSLVKLNRDLGLTVVLSEHRLERVVEHADRILYLDPEQAPLLGEPREVLAKAPLAPPIVQVGKLLGWQPLPLTIKEARRFTSGTDIAEPPLEPTATRDDAAPAFDLRGVWFAYGGREVLRGLDLRVSSGEITALMGRNGAGKTTILKLAVGLLKPARGHVTTLGLDTRRASLDDISRLVGYVPQQPDVLLFADTVQGEVDFTRRSHGLPPDGAGLLAQLGLARYGSADPRDLSVGERQRVALAAVLSGEPSAVVLDEPTRGLDYLQKEALAIILRGLRDHGKAVLLATHDVELAAQLADRVVLMGDGSVVADGPAREVMSGSLVFTSQVNKLFRSPALVTVDDVARIA
jgi:energy-coupling factor transport system ATP-binding protein